ncbi:hypothetical protein FACS1894190_17810 [Spirochaetia bacterium]|nr:hypothetical protein FACS1894190_17810 [Spirochaetia bacterium]
MSNQVAEQGASLSNQVAEKVSVVSSEVASVSGQLTDHVSSQVSSLSSRMLSISDVVTSLYSLVREEEYLHLELILKTIELQHTHQETFGEYKNYFQNRDAVLVATGPSAIDFEIIDNAVYVGVNGAVCFDKISLDYWFIQDYDNPEVKDYLEESLGYKNKYLKRFYGILNRYVNEKWVIPEKIIFDHKASKYYVKSVWYRKNISVLSFDWHFALDPSSQILRCYGSTVFAAMQFILYAHPKKIYLVGCDTANLGTHAVGKTTHDSRADPQECLEALLFGWKELKMFASIYYPDTEIISVNPVGLTGLFRDVYTESYLEKHPEIRGDVL